MPMRGPSEVRLDSVRHPPVVLLFVGVGGTRLRCGIRFVLARFGMRDVRLPGFLLGVVALLGCTSATSNAVVTAGDAGVDPVEAGPDAADADPGPDPVIVSRPYELHEPTGYDGSKPAPLVIGLHGYGDGDNADAFESWLRLGPEASKRGILYALPSGTLDSAKLPFWNATDACCNFYGAQVDDVAYIAALIDDVARTHALDRDRVYVVGVSGGGFMAHRLACDISERLAGVISISGATWKDASRCKPSSPIALVEMHGDADDTVLYEGGTIDLLDPPFPGAVETIEHWKSYAGCTGDLHAVGPALDLETKAAGAETQPQTYDTCARGDVELWTAHGGPHAPFFTAAFAPTLFDWFERHPKAHR
jgi:polyhydroxybutyrate depolymerase